MNNLNSVIIEGKVTKLINTVVSLELRRGYYDENGEKKESFFPVKCYIHPSKASVITVGQSIRVVGRLDWNAVDGNYIIVEHVICKGD